MAVQPIPEGYHSVTPYLVADGVGALIEFTKKAFGAEEIHRHLHPDGSIGHAEVRIGDSPVMMGGATSEYRAMPGILYRCVASKAVGLIASGGCRSLNRYPPPRPRYGWARC